MLTTCPVCLTHGCPSPSPKPSCFQRGHLIACPFCSHITPLQQPKPASTIFPLPDRCPKCGNELLGFIEFQENPAEGIFMDFPAETPEPQAEPVADEVRLYGWGYYHNQQLEVQFGYGAIEFVEELPDGTLEAWLDSETVIPIQHGRAIVDIERATLEDSGLGPEAAAEIASILDGLQTGEQQLDLAQGRVIDEASRGFLQGRGLVWVFDLGLVMATNFILLRMLFDIFVR
ncbi:hypothetical protein BJY04DRAFT_218352 [Aspergillus karnatakaensis]|uniref:uncharacterized protein n=1 Tax=Aspergillus karnatakaensis TaxID=1810916 RepID=UPI003CCC9045